MKIVSQLDESGVFVGSTVADESPLEPGVYLMPAGAVDVAPPSVPAGKVAKFQGGKWVLAAKPEKPSQAEGVPSEIVDPLQKLAAFLRANPDVLELVVAP